MINFIGQTIHFIWCFSYKHFIGLLWRCGAVDIKCKNQARRNYQRTAENFVKF